MNRVHASIFRVLLSGHHSMTLHPAWIDSAEVQTPAATTRPTISQCEFFLITTWPCPALPIQAIISRVNSRQKKAP